MWESEYGLWNAEGELADESGLSFKVHAEITYHWASPSDTDQVIHILVQRVTGSMVSRIKSGAWAFRGNSSDGLQVSAHGLHVTRVSIRAGELGPLYDSWFSAERLMAGTEEPVEHLQYHLPALALRFLESEESEGKPPMAYTELSTFGTSYDGFTVTLRPAPELNGKPVEHLAEAWGHLSVVAVVSRTHDVQLVIPSQVERLMASVDCAIGFATGLNRPWAVCEGYSAGTKRFRLVRRTAYVTGSSLPIVRPHNPFHLTPLLQRALTFFLKCNSSEFEDLRMFIWSVQYASAHLAFPIPFLLLGAALEEFIAAEIGGSRGSVISRDQAREIMPEFEEWIAVNVLPYISPDVSQYEFRDAIPNKFGALIQRSLANRIHALLQSACLPYDKDWVRDFVRKRDSAAHGTYEPGASLAVDATIYLRMVSLAHRYLLVRMGYVGPIIDWAEYPQSDTSKIAERGLVVREKFDEES